MTTKDKVARRKLSLLQLATEMDNVSKACKSALALNSTRYSSSPNSRPVSITTSGDWTSADKSTCLIGVSAPYKSLQTCELFVDTNSANVAELFGRILAYVGSACPRFAPTAG